MLDIKTYLRSCTINKAGLLVKLKQIPFQAKPVERIVIPRSHSFTFSKALHVKLDHPTKSQMLRHFNRGYYMLDEAKTLESVFNSCEYPCRASLLLPKEVFQFHSETRPNHIAEFFSADVLEEDKKVLILRENLTSFTATLIIKDQTKPTLRDGLIILFSSLRLSGSATVRVDPHSSFCSLKDDPALSQSGIYLEL